MRRLFHVTVAFATTLALVAGCSNKPPSISRVYARIIYQHDTATGSKTEGLSVFLVASDPDGMENLRSFYVINDEAELFWQVDSTSWVSSTAEGETWIGSNNLTMPDSQAIPVGSYRVLLQNAGGDTTEQSFTIASRQASALDAAYPSASVKDGAISISSPYQSVDIWTYGRDGRFVASFPTEGRGPALPVQKLVAASPALALGFSFRVFANNTNEGYGALSGPYNVEATTPPSAAPAQAAPPPLPSRPSPVP